MSHVLLVSLLGLPLGGCLGVTLAPQPLPDWAMNPQAQNDQQRADRATGAPRKKPRIARQRVPGELSAAQSALLIGESDAQPVARAMETKPFAPGWDAREDERDPSLRRTLNICRGC